MAEKQKYWVRSTEGTFAQLDGAAERDRWSAFGWHETTEPGGTDFVWMRRDGIAEPARLAWASRAYWEAQGWATSAPPEPVDPTKDPALVDQPEGSTRTAPAADTTGKASDKSATATDKKTKE